MSYQNRLPELKLSSKPKLIISKELQSEIMCLHNKVGDVEWSGPLFYKVVSGDINTPSELVLKALHVYPYNVGTSGYTEYDFDEKIMDFYEKYPVCTRQQGAKWGNLHTHHTMATFFSGTDDAELHDNSGKHNYYLSLIVNHKSDPKAKIAIVAERTVKINTEEDFISFKGTDGTPDKIDLISNARKDTKEKVLVMMDVDVEFEQDEFLATRITELKAAPRRVVVTHSPIGFKPKFTHNGGYQKNLYDGDDSWNDYYDQTYGPKNQEGGSKSKLYTEEPTEKQDLVFDTLAIKTFLVQWLEQDHTAQGKLSDTIKDVNKTTRGKILDVYLEKLDESMKDYICIIWDTEYLKITNDTVTDLAMSCIKELKQYPQFTITKDIIDLLDLYVPSNLEEEDDKVELTVTKK